MERFVISQPADEVSAMPADEHNAVFPMTLDLRWPLDMRRPLDLRPPQSAIEASA